jgi:hypothetical protein
MGMTNANLCPTLSNLTTVCIEMKDLAQAKVYAGRLQEIAKESKLKEFTMTTNKLIEKITNVRK